MKNYLAFFGSVCYPSGGMDDFLNDFDTLEEAIGAIKQKSREHNQGDWITIWANVYSLKDRMEVYTT